MDQNKAVGEPTEEFRIVQSSFENLVSAIIELYEEWDGDVDAFVTMASEMLAEGAMDALPHSQEKHTL